MPQGIVPFPFGQCRICNDKATGVHYGVATCEGCKGFYKRSTTRSEKYKCFFGGSCKLSPQTRNRCKACRYQLCLDAGMSLDAVKMGRIPKVDKERALEANRNNSTAPEQPQPSTNTTESPQETPPQYQWLFDDQKPTLFPQNKEEVPSAPMLRQITSTDLAPPPQVHNIPSPSQGNIPISNTSQEAKVNPLHPDRGYLHNTYPADQVPYQTGCHYGPQPNYAHDQQQPQQHQQQNGLVSHLPTSYQQPRSSPKHSPTVMFHHNPPDLSHPPPIHNADPTEASTPHAPPSRQPQRNHPYRRPPPPESYPDTGSSELSSGGSGYDSPGIPRQVYSPSIIQTLLSQVLDGSEKQLLSELVEKIRTSPLPSSGQNSVPRELVDQLLNSSSLPSSQSGLDSTEALLLQRLLPALNARFSSSSSPSSSSSSSVNLAAVKIEPEPEMDSASSRAIDCSRASHKQKLSTLLSPVQPDDDNTPPLPSQSSDESSILTVPAAASPNDKQHVSERVLQIKDTIQRCTELDRKYNCHKRVKVQQMKDELSGKRKPHYLNTLKESSYLQAKYMWGSLFASIPIINDWLLSMAKEIPGFKNLEKTDQGILMEEAFFSIWLMQNIAFFHGGESYMRMLGGQCYSHWWMRHFLPEELVNTMFKIVFDLKDCELSETELIILCAIQLSDPDRKGLVDVDKVQLLHNHYLDVLAYEIQNTHPDTHSRILINIFRILPMLGPLSYQQNQVIGQFCLDKPSNGVLKWNPESTDVGGIPEDELIKLKAEIASSKTALTPTEETQESASVPLTSSS